MRGRRVPGILRSTRTRTLQPGGRGVRSRLDGHDLYLDDVGAVGRAAVTAALHIHASVRRLSRDLSMSRIRGLSSQDLMHMINAYCSDDTFADSGLGPRYHTPTSLNAHERPRRREIQTPIRIVRGRCPGAHAMLGQAGRIHTGSRSASSAGPGPC